MRPSLQPTAFAMPASLLALVMSLPLAGCSESDDASSATGDNGATDTATADASSDASGSLDTGGGNDAADDGDAGQPGADAASAAIGVCRYTNPFSDGAECKRYTGPAWDATSAEDDCAAPFPGATDGRFELGGECTFETQLGECVVEGDDGYVLVLEGSDAERCGVAKAGCESFGGGMFEPVDTCVDGGGGTGGGGGAFIQPYESCQEPREDDESGDGEVCTNVAISGCTEPGKSFEDYGACDVVQTQRPYWPYEVDGEPDDDDPRLADAEYMAELEWAREQVDTCACVCCHSDELAPDGPAGWYVEAPIWVDTVPDAGLAMLAGWVDSTALGAYPEEENNGFNRTDIGLPTTDVSRMRSFLEGELARRGITRDDADEIPPFGGPIYEQLVFEPSDCTGGEGVAADGTVTWSGDLARYVYVLERGADNPGVPPNLDLPEGTIWRLDVASDASPVSNGLQYGSTPDGASQRFPADGEPAPLTEGETYYLYVLLDVGIPLTRCLFEYPAGG